MRTMLDAVRAERPHLLLPRPVCGHCGLRSAKVGPLCCACDEDSDAREEYAARVAREDVER